MWWKRLDRDGSFVCPAKDVYWSNGNQNPKLELCNFRLTGHGYTMSYYGHVLWYFLKYALFCEWMCYLYNEIVYVGMCVNVLD